MKNRNMIAELCVLLLLLLAACQVASGLYQVKYAIEVRPDGSAIWVIEQTGTDFPASPNTFADFRDNVTSLIEVAENLTGRTMIAINFKFSADVAIPYILARYEFEWKNFSEINGTRIVLGDVFDVEGFFDRLVGQGSFLITYPSQYAVQSVTPEPYEQNSTFQKLFWVGTLSFGMGQPEIVLEEVPSLSFWDSLAQNAFLFFLLVVVIVGSSAGFYMLKIRSKKEHETSKTSTIGNTPIIEDDKAKIVKMLKASGGNMHQSAIVRQSNFSKAKTSQLLATLETSGMIKRYKKGRDKIVVLAERTGEK